MTTGFTVQDTNDDMVNLLSAHFQGRYEPQFGSANALSIPLGMAQLRGFWPMSSVDENGDVYDLSGQGRTLNNNSATPFAVDGLASYASLDGATNYFNRTDEAGLDITGSLTVVAWIWIDVKEPSYRPVLSKWGNVGQYAYMFYLDTFDQMRLAISSDGTAITQAFNNTDPQQGGWAFVAGRFTPATEIAVWSSGGDSGRSELTKETNTTSIPASIFNSNADLMIGWVNSTYLTFAHFDGRISMCFLCADALSDAAIFTLFQQTRPLFGV